MRFRRAAAVEVAHTHGPSQPLGWDEDCTSCNPPFDLPLRDRLSLWCHDVRRRWRRCPECGRRGYGVLGPGPGATYRWVDDPIVKSCGFDTFPHRCNTCGQTLGRDS